MQLKSNLSDEEAVKLGLKSGLEIHQQLQGRKLFARTPTIIRDDEPDYTIRRRLRASAGESGLFDIAAQAEVKKRKYFLYQGYHDTISLVELDEEPPAPVSNDAVTAALQISKLLSMTPVDELRFMRKVVIDGSNTSGFQRTGLVAVDGKLETSQGTVGIETLCLEEDSAKAVERHSTHAVYNLSRLGIPLIEIATAPDLKTPQHIAETAEQLGMMLRSLDNVKRGLGTIRQDVNVSIKDGVRVEIKGAQDLRMIAELARNEALRQYNLLELYKELENNKVAPPSEVEIRDGSKPSYLGDHSFSDVTEVFNGTSCKLIASSVKEKNIVLGARLPGYAGYLGLEIQPGRRYGSEISDHAKIFSGVKGMIHSDEDLKGTYSFSDEEIVALRKELHCTDADAFVLVTAERERAENALFSIMNRASDRTLFKEVRMARPDGTSSYLRPMPGASRMYPETDVPPTTIDMESVEAPTLLSERISELAEKHDIAEDIAKRLLRDGHDLDELTTRFDKLKASFIIDCLYSLPTTIAKKEDLDVSDEHVLDLLERLNREDITKESLEELLIKKARGEAIDYSAYKPVSLENIRDDVAAIVKEMSDAPRGAIMGKVMGKYKGKADGKELAKLVNELLSP